MIPLKNDRFDCIIVGAGLSALVAACCIRSHSKKSVAVVTVGLGGTPYLAAFNGILPEAGNGDSLALYQADMYRAGYRLSNMDLVKTLAVHSPDVVALLEAYGVCFARRGEGYLLRQVSGSSVPRSLCNTDHLIGEEIVEQVIPRLRAQGVTFLDHHTCVKVLKEGDRVCGITVLDRAVGRTENLYAPAVLAAWGGVGNLYRDSTYPGDIDGRGIALALDAGAGLVDLEFVEFEPMVVLDPPDARGEPCPTAMLGEGAHLLNTDGERFLLPIRPQGEAGAPKSLINRELWKQVEAGKGTERGGVYVDLRHIDLQVLKAYPWFYNRVLKAGLDVKRELLEVGPAAHSHSGGIEIDGRGRSCVEGLYAAGEAAGGMHGACRMAGNAATMAALSGYAAGMDIAARELPKVACDCPAPGVIPAPDGALCGRIRDIVSTSVNRKREETELAAAMDELAEIAEQAEEDVLVNQMARAAYALTFAARSRRESRGTHTRTDYPDMDEAYDVSLRIKDQGGALSCERKELPEFRLDV